MAMAPSQVSSCHCRLTEIKAKFSMFPWESTHLKGKSTTFARGFRSECPWLWSSTRNKHSPCRTFRIQGHTGLSHKNGARQVKYLWLRTSLGPDNKQFLTHVAIPNYCQWLPFPQTGDQVLQLSSNVCHENRTQSGHTGAVHFLPWILIWSCLWFQNVCLYAYLNHI